MKVEVKYNGIPAVRLIPEDRRDIEIFHRLAEHNNLRISYSGVPGSVLRMEPIMVRPPATDEPA